MVSFTCNVCQDVVKKPKVVGHAQSCGSHSFTCVDCMQVFDLNTIKPHTTCVTEVQKYQGKWLQKNNNGPARKRNPDSSDEDESRKGTRDGLLRPPRATMDDLDTDSDEDWVSKTKTSAAKKTTAKAPTGSKRPRPGMAASSSDDEDDVTAPRKQAKTTPKQVAKKPASAPRTPSKATTPAATPAADHAAHHRKGHTPLMLPRSTATTECEVASFVLDNTESLAEIVKDILANEGGCASSMKKKDLAKALVQRYLVRIAKKGVMPAVDAAVQLGCLQEDAHGNVRPA